MYRTEGVLAFIALYVGLAHSCWDIVVPGNNQLEFYDNNGTRTHIEDIPSYRITSLAYDPVHNRVLIADETSANSSISSFDISTRKIIYLYRSVQNAYIQIAFDPATQLLFWTETGSASRNSILSKPAINTVHEKLIIKLDWDGWYIYGMTVDSSGGYIYWGTRSKIERARFDGSEREVVIDKNVAYRTALTIDHHTQKMYWLDNLQYGSEYKMSVESADLNGKNRRTLYSKQGGELALGLLVSKDFVYWRRYTTLLKLTKNPPHNKELEPKQFSLAGNSHAIGMAFNYKIQNQTLEIQNCEAQTRPLPINSETNDCASLNVSTDVSLLCVHGTRVSGESRCECTQGYIGERCEVSVCHNYCLQGDCSVSAEGQPKCRCNASYSGERCEVSVCQNYCFQGHCSASADEGQLMCRCNAGFSGERCEVTACSTPTIVTDAASNSTINGSHNIISQELNNTLKRWRTDDMDAMAKFTDDIKGTLRVWREEIEISIQSKLNDNIKCTLTDKKQEMNSLRCSEDEKLKEYVRTHDVSELKSSAQFQAAEPKELKERVDTIAPHSSEQSQKLVSSPEQKIDSLSSK